MEACAFIGDEVTAAGFRLAGFEVYIPAAEEVTGVLVKLSEEMELVIITAEMAQAIPDQFLHQAIVRGRPLILVIPDIRRRLQPVDLSAGLRQQLGMSE